MQFSEYNIPMKCHFQLWIGLFMSESLKWSMQIIHPFMTLFLFIIYCNTGPCLTGNLIADWSVVIFYIKFLMHLVHITGNRKFKLDSTVYQNLKHEVCRVHVCYEMTRLGKIVIRYPKACKLVKKKIIHENFFQVFNIFYQRARVLWSWAKFAN